MLYRTLFLSVILVVFILHSGCKSMVPATHDTGVDTESVAESTADVLPLRPAVPQDTSSAINIMPVPAETLSMITHLTDFSFDLYKKLSQDNATESFSFSPVSLNMALAAIYSGAAGQTRRQMSDITGFAMDADLFHRHYFAYFSGLTDLFKDTLVEFDLANRVFLEQTYTVLESYINDVQAWHGGAFEQVDFINQPRQAETLINKWVEGITRNRIKDLVPAGTLSDLTRMVLANAIYIKSSWKFPFDEDATYEKDFHTLAEVSVPLDFMVQRKKGISFLEMEDRLVMELPYTSPNLSLLLILPNATQPENLTAYVPDAAQYRRILNELRPEDVYMEIPKFKIETQFSLSEPLKAKGMKNAFDGRADFSGISNPSDLEISEILQKVFFEIDEKGSEAAAATAIIMVTTSIGVDMEMQEPKQFIANRPFLFILKENFFDTPLFIGQFMK